MPYRVDVPAVERAPGTTIHDIAITFAPQYRFTKIHVEPGGRELEMKTTPAGIRIVLPRLDVHAIIVGELDDKK